jgi:hypothetical protein
MVTHPDVDAEIGATGTATARAMASAPETEASISAVDHELIARLAYQFWEARGCPNGSAEEDWFRAEQELRGQAASVANRSDVVPRESV